MRNNNTTTKNIKFNKQLFKYSILVQIIILLLFVPLIYESKPIDADDCVNGLIVINKKDYKREYSEYKCVVYSNENKYVFPNLGIFGEYTTKELYEKIAVGEQLDIICIKKYGLFGTYNLIVDAKTDNNVYLDFDSYNLQKEKAFLSVIISFCTIELLFLMCIAIGSIVYRKMINPCSKKQRKK